MEHLKQNTKSFVELDYFKKNCINIITKNKSIGLIGGISLNKKDETIIQNSHKRSAHTLAILLSHRVLHHTFVCAQIS